MNTNVDIKTNEQTNIDETDRLTTSEDKKPREKNQEQGKNNNPQRKTKRKRIRKNQKLKIAVINIRGAKGKLKSLESILTTHKIAIALITETIIANKEGFNIKGYEWIGRNRN